MPTIDEQVREYMRGYAIGVKQAHFGAEFGYTTDTMRRGYADGRSAYLAAEQAERERLERCEACGGSGEGAFDLGRLIFDACPACHGTGRRA